LNFELKKLTTILIIFCYLIPAIGLSVKQHFCGGKLASVSILFNSLSSCPCGEKAMKKNCCKDKTIVLKLKDSQNFSKKIAINFSQTFKFLVDIFPGYSHSFVTVAFQRHIPFDHPPPLQKSKPLYLLNRVFLI